MHLNICKRAVMEAAIYVIEIKGIPVNKFAFIFNRPFSLCTKLHIFQNPDERMT